MRENGLRNEEIIRTIIIREYESYFAVMYTTWAVVKIRPGKKFRPVRRTHDPYETGAALYQPSQQANWELVITMVPNKPGCLGW